jgi:hypothetical protein
MQRSILLLRSVIDFFAPVTSRARVVPSRTDAEKNDLIEYLKSI